MSEPTKGRIIPTLRYRDAHAAIEWLGRAFGFEARMVVPDDEGGVAHAQLVGPSGMIMLGTQRDDEFGRWQHSPLDFGGVGTQSPYVVVDDADAVYERARAQGAEIVYDIRDEDYGGRGFTCRDPEQHLWSFGTYDPWAAE